MFKKKRNKPISFRVTEEFNTLIDILSEKLMISKTAVFTIAITELAKREGLLYSEEIQLNMEELVAEVFEQLATDLIPLTETIATMASSMKALKERLVKLEETKQVKDKSEKLQHIFSLKKAGEAEEIAATEGD